MQATIPHRRGNRRALAAVALATVLILTAPWGSAARAGSAREQLEQIRERQAQISREAARQRALLARLEAEARTAAEAYARAQREEKEANRQLAEVTAALSQAQAALQEAEAELDRASRQLEARQQALGDRVRSAYVYPVQQPARITDGFGWRLHPILKTRRFHAGVDFAVRVGQPIYAAADGKVLYAGWQNGYGNVVIIGHGKVQGKSVATLYSHNSALTVRVGQEVKRGDVVALGGSTGLATGPNVHFEVIVDGKQVDPMGWLPK